MKINFAVTCIIATLACKVSAKCFATEFGYPCCTKKVDPVELNEDGVWGYENGKKCGIERNRNPFRHSKHPWNNFNEKRGNIYNMNKWKNYMDTMQKLVIDYIPEGIDERSDDVVYPEVIKTTYFSNTTQTERKVDIVLPVNYKENKKYPVFYYLHGIFVDPDYMLQEELGTLPIYGNLLHQKLAREMLIVIPDQYAPLKGHEFPPELNQDYYDGYDNFINDLVNDLMPFIANNFRIRTGREHTAIGGFSFGGRNSLYIGYVRSDLFGYVGALSPAPGVTPGVDQWSNHKGLLSENELVAKIPPIVTFISGGTNDPAVGTFPRQYSEILTRNHQEHVYLSIPGGEHDPFSNKVGFLNFVMSLFGNLKHIKEDSESDSESDSE